MTELSDYIRSTTLIDTHEHLVSEQTYLNWRRDLTQTLLGHYTTNDLDVASPEPGEAERIMEDADLTAGERFERLAPAWERVRHTGYGEASRLAAREVYGLETLTRQAIDDAENQHQQLRQPGQRLRLLRDVGNLDHVQIDNFTRDCPPDESGPDFFLYDLSWEQMASGRPSFDDLASETGVTVTNLDTLESAMRSVFEINAPTAVAVKTQHAYSRTLAWRKREADEVRPVLEKALSGGELTVEEKLCLGDWCLERGVELAAEHRLPVKIHTGYYAGTNHLAPERIRAGHLCDLVQRHLDTDFVLMHTAYPYTDELLAMAKHIANVYVDLCWAWSISPNTTQDFVRRFIHTVPSHKLLGFGGDTGQPQLSVGFAVQARRWLERALQAEVDDGLLTESKAIELAERFMRRNQRELFDLDGTRAAIRGAAAASG